MAEPFIGEIRMFGGNFAPSGWALCDGQLLSISQNTALFSSLGTSFGGDGVRTFALPDLRGRVPIHAGQGPGLSPYTLGESGGAESVTLVIGQIPTHNHLVNADTGDNGASSHPNGQYLASTGATSIYNSNPDSTMNPNMIQPVGGSQPHTNVEPFLCVNFIIALQGIFPSRN
ncbi:MAG: phage tail protein [Candidatus Binataceae bacterium]